MFDWARQELPATSFIMTSKLRHLYWTSWSIVLVIPKLLRLHLEEKDVNPYRRTGSLVLKLFINKCEDPDELIKTKYMHYRAWCAIFEPCKWNNSCKLAISNSTPFMHKNIITIVSCSFDNGIVKVWFSLGCKLSEHTSKYVTNMCIYILFWLLSLRRINIFCKYLS
jgi:hypothetical protein